MNKKVHFKTIFIEYFFIIEKRLKIFTELLYAIFIEINFLLDIKMAIMQTRAMYFLILQKQKKQFAVFSKYFIAEQSAKRTRVRRNGCLIFILKPG